MGVDTARVVECELESVFPIAVVWVVGWHELIYGPKNESQKNWIALVMLANFIAESTHVEAYLAKELGF